MTKKAVLLRKLMAKPTPTAFTTRELDTLMGQCGCKKFTGGRGSGIGYYHEKTKRILQFDGPHPGNELYRYQVKMVMKFLISIGEVEK